MGLRIQARRERESDSVVCDTCYACLHAGGILPTNGWGERVNCERKSPRFSFPILRLRHPRGLKLIYRVRTVIPRRDSSAPCVQNQNPSLLPSLPSFHGAAFQNSKGVDTLYRANTNANVSPRWIGGVGAVISGLFIGSSTFDVEHMKNDLILSIS